MEKALIVIYEIEQVELLKRYLRRLSKDAQDTMVVVPIGADIEFLLEREGVTFESGKNLRSVSHEELILFVERLGSEMLDDKTFSFFSYRNIHLSDVYLVALQNYLQNLLYFVDIMTTVAEVHTEHVQWRLFPTTKVPYKTGGVFVRHEVDAALQAAHLVAKSFGVTVQTLSFSPTFNDIKRILKRKQFETKRFLFGQALSLWNLYVTYAVGPKDFSILMSDMWKNTKALMDKLPECEVILLDRTEALNIGLRRILNHRFRFVHLENSISHQARKRIATYQVSVGKQVEDILKNNTALQKAIFRTHSLSMLLYPVLKDMVFDGGNRAVVQIEGVHTLIEKMKPNIVWVRASISAQTHFPILCLVAKQYEIPSVEVQHGILYLGPRALSNRPAAQYIATYGPLTAKELKRFGYTEMQLPSIGSPRFDVYRSLRVRRKRKEGDEFVVACVAPAVLYSSWSDSYEIVEYYKHLAQAVAHIKNVKVVIKLRPMSSDESFLKEAIGRAFVNTPYHIAQWEPMVEVMESADAIVAIYSTTVLEGLISGRPVIYDGFMDMHRLLGEELVAYEAAGALVRIQTTEALTERLRSYVDKPQEAEGQVIQAESFMKENYSFDGDASQRLADFLRDLAKR